MPYHMSSSRVVKAFVTMITTKAAKIQSIFENIRGGYEVWMQVEFAAYLIRDDDNRWDVVREQAYGDSQNSRCDFVMRPRVGVPYFLEIKVQNYPGEDVAVKYIADVDKIKRIAAEYKQNNQSAIFVAMVFIYAITEADRRALYAPYKTEYTMLEYVGSTQGWSQNSCPDAGKTVVAYFVVT